MRPPPSIAAIAATAALAFVLSLSGFLAAQGQTRLGEFGEAGGTPAEAIAAEVTANTHWVGLQTLFLGAAGLALMVLALALRPSGGSLWVRLGAAGGVLWGALAIVAGSLLFSAIDLAGHFEHPSGAKTILSAAPALLASPAAVLPAVLFIASFAAEPPAGAPRWFGRFSGVAAVGGAVGAVGFASYFFGAMALVLVPVWFLVLTGLLLAKGLARDAAPA